ncbi:hypothetical protein ACJJTC_002381 [Scirpophaga incertulas]
MDEVALQNVNDLNQDEPERPACVPRGSRSDIPQTSVACSPMSSPGSSPSSSVSISPRARQLIRKLRYKKDKEIECLRNQLQSVKKMSETYRKQISRLQDKSLKNSSDQQTACSSRDTYSEISPPLNAQSGSNSLGRYHSNNSLASSLCKGILQSYKSIKSSKMKHTVSNILEPHLKSPAIDNTSQKRLKKIFRRRNKSIKNVTANKKNKDVREFLSDDTNSSCAAGKKEFVKKHGVKVQVRYLNDSLKNLHTKFVAVYKYRLCYTAFWYRHETFSKLLKKKLTNIIIKIITDDHILQKDPLLPSNLRPFKGTLQVHQAVWDHSKSSVALRKLSCTEHTCLTNATYCHHGKHLGFQFVKRIENTTESDSDNASNHSSNQTELVTVTNLERCSIFSASCEMELPPELRRSVLDNILMEDPENKTESPLSSHITNIFNSDSDSSDYEIF